MIERAIRSAQAEFYDRVGTAPGCDAFLAYVRSHRLDILAIGWHVGVTAVMPIKDHPGSRFDFADDGELAFVCECYAADGETVTDVVAWRLDAPERPMTMFGRCGLLGLWQANAPGTYFMSGTLVLHRSPLLWLQAGCNGAAIVDRHMAGRQLLDIPGRISAEDKAHGREIAALLRAAADIDNKVIAPLQQRSAT
jgi:hypothetical protein